MATGGFRVALAEHLTNLGGGDVVEWRVNDAHSAREGGGAGQGVAWAGINQDFMVLQNFACFEPSFKNRPIVGANQ